MTVQAMSSALFQAAQQVEAGFAGEKRKEAPEHTAISPTPTAVSPTNVPQSSFEPKAKMAATSRSRAIRLEQNRKAARESRRRKKAMIEELQRSLMFFSKSNTALKQQNELLTRQLLDAHSVLAKTGKAVPPMDPKTTEVSASQAMARETLPVKVESQGVLESSTNTSGQDISSIQPGATMQAMANFQQAAQAAMEAASRKMMAHGVVVNPEELAKNEHNAA